MQLLSLYPALILGLSRHQAQKVQDEATSLSIPDFRIKAQIGQKSSTFHRRIKLSALCCTKFSYVGSIPKKRG